MYSTSTLTISSGMTGLPQGEASEYQGEFSVIRASFSFSENG